MLILILSLQMQSLTMPRHNSPTAPNPPVLNRTEGVQRAPASQDGLNDIFFSRDAENCIILSRTAIILSILPNATGPNSKSVEINFYILFEYYPSILFFTLFPTNLVQTWKNILVQFAPRRY